ncbi:hypothetical protein AcV5_010524 [Taiwanofungus camphoratus]|nr:hypothetical protein AcV5_010524 [Antrodia cinnamomea]
MRGDLKPKPKLRLYNLLVELPLRWRLLLCHLHLPQLLQRLSCQLSLSYPPPYQRGGLHRMSRRYPRPRCMQRPPKCRSSKAPVDTNWYQRPASLKREDLTARDSSEALWTLRMSSWAKSMVSSEYSGTKREVAGYEYKIASGN